MRGSKGWIIDSLVPRPVPSFPLFVEWKSGRQKLGEGGWVDGFLVQWIPDHSQTDWVRKGLGNNLVRSVLLGFSLLPRLPSSNTLVSTQHQPQRVSLSRIPHVIVEVIYALDEVWGRD